MRDGYIMKERHDKEFQRDLVCVQIMPLVDSKNVTSRFKYDVLPFSWDKKVIKEIEQQEKSHFEIQAAEAYARLKNLNLIRPKQNITNGESGN
jgi:hypothetical protein